MKLYLLRVPDAELFLKGKVQQWRVVEHQPGHGGAGIADLVVSVIVQYLDLEVVKTLGKFLGRGQLVAVDAADLHVLDIEVMAQIRGAHLVGKPWLECDGTGAVALTGSESYARPFYGDPEFCSVVGLGEVLQQQLDVPFVLVGIAVVGEVKAVGWH
ncbi:MAG: hypothetical protein ACQETL_16370 [Bacteroidota bacterium]